MQVSERTVQMHKNKPQVNFLLTPLIVSMLLLGLLATAPLAVSAQESGGQAAAAQVATVTPNDVNEIAKELWGPLCSGVRLDACELKACEQMRDMIAVQLSEGQEKQEIKDYFIAQYGPQVLGEPPLEGFNWLAWILPFVALIGGGVFVWHNMHRMVSTSSKASDFELVEADSDSTKSTAKKETIALPQPSDEYSKRLNEELKHYD